MNTQLIPFAFKGKPIRVTLWQDAPWFIAADVCRALEMQNTTMALGRLEDDEKHTIYLSYTKNPSRLIISESGLYALVMRSNKPEAREFQRWVTRDVLPSIRKTGSYNLQGRDEFLTAVEKLVEPIKGRFAEHDQLLSTHDDRIDNHEIRLVAVEGRIVDRDWSRKYFSAKDIRRLARCVDACFGGVDPVTGIQPITDGRGHFLPKIAELDHFNGNRRDNRIENALPMHGDTHKRKTAGENFLPAFNEFHRKRLEFEARPGPLFDVTKHR